MTRLVFLHYISRSVSLPLKAQDEAKSPDLWRPGPGWAYVRLVHAVERAQFSLSEPSRLDLGFCWDSVFTVSGAQ